MSAALGCGADGPVLTPRADGAVYADGAPVPSDGARVDRDGAIALPDGDVVAPDGGGPIDTDGAVGPTEFCGRSWSAATLLESAAGDVLAYGPRVAGSAGTGGLAATWIQHDGDAFAPWSNRFAGGSWSGATRIAPTPDGALDARIGVDSSGRAVAAWVQEGATSSNRQMWASRFDPSSGWSAAQQLVTPAVVAANPELGIAADGTAVVAWEGRVAAFGRGDLWAARLTPSSGWQSAVLVEHEDSDAVGYPRVGLDAAGIATVAWHQPDASTQYRGWASRDDGTSSWSTPVIVDTSPVAPLRLRVQYPRVAVDDSGAAIVVWTQRDPVDVAVTYAYASRRPAGSSAWGTPIELGLGSDPVVALSADGRGVVAWREFVEARTRVARLHLVAYDPASGFGTVATIVDGVAAIDGPAVAIHASGAIVVWSEQAGTMMDLRASCLAGGSGTWSAPAALESNDLGEAVSPSVAIDGTGRAAAVWAQTDGSQRSVWGAVLE